MKLTLFIILLSISSLKAGTSYSQSTRLNLNLKDATVKDALMNIEEKSDFFFLFNSKLINVNRKVNVNVKNERIDDILKQIFKETDVVYTVVDKQIILTNKENLASLNQISANIMKQFAITGKVTSSVDGQALPGVSISAKGTNNGAITDMDGKYTINVDENATLVFSFMGFLAQEVAVNGLSTIDVVLEEETKGLDEVVVIGYGTVKKSDLTGSVSSVSSDALTSFPTSGAVQAMQGRAAGVTIQSNNGDPGGSVTVRIRGGTSVNASSNPLYVVDGFPGSALPEPEDIASLEVLKDASATAIYGSRGANGVIMITTKKGTKGKVKIEYNNSFSEQQETNRIEMLNVDQFLDLQQPYYPTYVSDGENTDWQEMIFQKGNTQTHQLSLSGGAENVNYYISGSYYDQNGIITGSGFNKYSITSNIDIIATKKLKVGINLFGQRSNTDGVLTQEGSGGSTGAGVIGSALRYMPDMGIYKPDGVTYSVGKLGDPIDNPYTIINENTRNVVNDRLRGNFSAAYQIVENLTFNATIGVEANNGRTGTYASSLTNAGAGKGNATMGTNKNSSFSSENFINYSPKIGENHNLNLMAGYTYSYDKRESLGASSNAFITDAFSFWNMGGGTETPSIATSGLVDEKLSSFYGRVNYGFNEKYLVTFTARYDGSSKFSKNEKWALFPSGSVAWNVHKESFMQNLSVISQLKLRASYGMVGSQAINPYETLAKLSPVLSVVNGVQVNAVRPSAVANDNLVWETTASTNIGTDLGLIGNRIILAVDLYKNITSDLLFPVNLPPYSGFQTQTQNYGKNENKGMEFTLYTKNFTGGFKWNTDFNISFNRNQVLELPNGKEILYGNAPGHWPGFANARIMREGEPLGSFYGYIYDGVYQTGETPIPGGGFEQTAGGEKYRDIDGRDASNVPIGPDNLLNINDQTIIGNPHPDYTFGFNNEFSYKGFDLVIFINGSQGNDIYSYQFQELDNLGAYGYNATTAALNRWTTENENTNVPMKNLSRALRPSTRWIMDGSYVRIKNLMLGYSLPKSILQKVNIQKVRIYVSAQNFVTFTKYKGFDPEVNYRASNLTLGTDYASYPMTKSLTAGLNIAF